MSEKNRPWSSLPAIAFAILAITGLAYLGSATRFMADDYCSAYYAERFGLLRSIWYWYLNWSGRYAAFVFDWLVLIKTFGPYGAPLVPPIELATWLIATIATITITLKTNVQRAVKSIAVLIGVSVVLTVMVLSPDIPQSYFWLNGLRSYSLPLVMLSIAAFLFQWLLPKLKSGRAVALGCMLASGLAFANGGTSETFAVFQLVLLLLLAWLAWFTHDRKMDPRFKLLAFAALGALLSVIVIVLAPGNALRRAELPHAPGLIQLTGISAVSYLAFLQDILFSPQKITALLGAMLVCAWAGTGYKTQLNFRGWIIPALIAGGLITSFVCVPPSVYGYVEAPPPRTLSIAAFGLTAFWMAASFLIGSRLGRISRSSAGMEIGLIVLATLSIGISSILTMSYVSQKRGEYIAYARKWDAMNAQILQARADGQPSVTIPAMISWAGVEHPNDHKKFWATACYSEYYGIQVYGPPY